jgi:5-formyltetrahydrofolate cyclo-ligase
VPSAVTAPPTSPLPSQHEHKHRLRAEARERRQKLARDHPPPLAGEKAARRILAELQFPAGSVVSAYWAMGDELDCRALIQSLHDSGCVIGLPVVVAKGQPLVFRRWTPESSLIPGGFGTQIPHPDSPEVLPERLIVPLLAFDSIGYRLGYGGGFYDRTLAKLRALGPVHAIGYAYAGQEVDVVPRESYDQPLDWMATEEFLRPLAQGTSGRER